MFSTTYPENSSVLHDDASAVCLVIAACAVHEIWTWMVGAEMFGSRLRAGWQEDGAGWCATKALPSPAES